MIDALSRIIAFKLLRDRWKARRRGAPRLVAPAAGSSAAGDRSGPAAHQGVSVPDEHPHPSGRAGVPTQRKGGPGPDTPLELDAADWRSTLRRTVKEVKADRVSFAAAGMAHFFFLAIFPALIAFVGILGLVHIDESGLVDSLQSSLPGGAGTALTHAVAGADRPSQAASVIATVTGISLALWSASSGFVALQRGLNIAYAVTDDRKFLKARVVAAALLIATMVLGGVPSPIFVFGESAFFTILGWIATLVAVSVLFSIFYYLGPNRPSPSWHWVSAGGVIGSGLWIIVSIGFGFYVSTFNSYGKTYGPLAGVIALILWLYLSSIAVLVGGELNAELERSAARSQRHS